MELTLFFIVAAVAVAAAALMLISENAVHSALFLIVNFACIAFLFLMLHAPFLALVQITVYTGAIMVLFLFVIMLLGAERVQPEQTPRFSWMTPVAVILALAFLAVASTAIIQGDIELTTPRVADPQVRVANALSGAADGIDVYLNDERIAQDLDYRESTTFDAWDAGQYTIALYAAGADPEADEPLYQQPIELTTDDVLTLAAAGTMQEPLVVVAAEDMGPIDDEDGLRFVAINALPDRAAIDVARLTRGGERRVLIEGLSYGEASEAVDLQTGSHTIAVYPAGDSNTRLAEYEDVELDDQTAALWVFGYERRPDNSWRSEIVTFSAAMYPAFGGPHHVGELLFSRYLLPFEMVALVLLVAMIGAIVLTHEAREKRQRLVRRLANVPSPTVEQQAPGEAGK
ncbi:MAG: DUF4397 domain-containing protein [Chloroflexi bacterium]|nr:DUF4397 domain-containing protein [Chloroflexota bacterium]